jgi:predicted dehydrogenase/NADPH:quinone reductase-like Zn-dependent oxidoreductase
VLEVGSHAEDLSVGDRVAVVRASHASVVTVPASRVFRLPAEADLDDAAFVQLGVICGQGVRRAAIQEGEEVCVIGAGVVGLLAQRLALASGSGRVTLVARSRSKEAYARNGGVGRFLVVDDDPAAVLRHVESPVVIEATGDPDVYRAAVAAAAPGGRIVLLGSPRGVSRGLPLDEIRSKRLELVGAHVETLRYEAGNGLDPYRREAERFLDLLATKHVEVDDLAGPRIDPREADAFYRELARSRELTSARFDWTLLPASERVTSGSLVRPPALRATGVEVDRPLRSRRSTKPDPFADAAGMLRIGLIGCGDIAFHNAKAIGEAPNTRLVACYDPVQDLASELARMWGAAATSTLDGLLERVDVDAVFIAAPHHVHGSLAAQAALAGKHVIVEKPLAHTLEAAVQLVTDVERAGVTLSVCFPHRYETSISEARALIDGGAIGRLGGTLVNFFAEKPASYWLGGFSGRATSTWRAARDLAGGGVLIMNLSHLLDVIRFMTRAEVDLCSAVTGITDRPAEVEDTVTLSLRYANGAVGSLMGSSSLRGHRGGRTDLHIWGDDGYLVVEPEMRVFTSRVAGAGLPTTRWHAISGGPHPDIRSIYVSRLASALERGETPEVSADDALAVQAIIEAAYRSTQTGQAVRPADLLAQARDGS